LSTPYLAPGNEAEQKLVGIWEELLGIEGLGVHDNFFELGGHSLLATQLASRVRAMFEVEVPLRRMFESPTVAGLAGIVGQGREEREKAEQLKILKRLESQSEAETEAELNTLLPLDPVE
jgi:phthiocerol/phenolphthiocerol synthesis type-I polyketide synthase E